MRKRILEYPDPVLRLPCIDLEKWDDDVANKVRKMFKVMYRTGVGVGLAAPQVGWSTRLFIMNPDTNTKKPEAQRVFFNPVISPFGSEVPIDEGCLSVPGFRHKIRRFESVRLVAETPKGKIEEVFTGFPAQIVQHEMDHLNGRLFIDRLDVEGRQAFREWYVSASSRGEIHA